MSLVGSFIMGFSFALGWSPCTGPFLASIMTMAMTPGSTSYWGLLLILFYALGMGIPFFLTGLATRLCWEYSGGLKSHYKVVEIFSGTLLTILAVILLSDPVLKVDHRAGHRRYRDNIQSLHPQHRRRSGSGGYFRRCDRQTERYLPRHHPSARRCPPLRSPLKMAL